MNDTIIEIKELTKNYKLYERNAVDRFIDTFVPGNKKKHKEFTALKNVNLEIKKGEILGIIGRNGAGKSTLLKLIAGITQPTSGSVNVKGRIVPLLELGGGFNPEYTGRENIYFYCSLQGMRKDEIDAIYDDILEFAEIDDFIDIPIKKYSSGMKARLSFSVSVNIDPEILIVDEVLAVGDELFKRKCYARMEELFEKGKTVIFVSHSVGSIEKICNRAILLHHGELLFDSTPAKVIPFYRRMLSNDSDNELIKKIKKDNGHKHKIKNERVNIKPKSKKVIKKRNIDIKNIKLLNQQGNEVNNIICGDDLEITADVMFNEACKNVSFGTVIYSIEGINQAGAYLPVSFRWIKDIENGESYKLTFPFKALFEQGTYFIRIVVRGQIKEIRDIVAIVQDAIAFKVDNSLSTEFDSVTMVNLFSKPELIKK